MLCQPIDTAPRDGTEIEAFDDAGPLGLAHFHCGEWLVYAGRECGWEVVEPTRWAPDEPGDGGLCFVLNRGPDKFA